ncbi:MAG: hypothetical protein EPO08_10755 [Rhodospirillaceae bacterium]|nr:MAG: hypothetical protein EPO08_10755 [Rhodospirillaceae bacterium]
MDSLNYLKFILALIFVLGLIMGLAWLLKRLGLGMSAGGVLTRRRRIRTVETAMLDGRHRLVLIRRDDVEHLIMIGPNTSQVIERSIPATALPDGGAEEYTPPFRKFLAKDTPQ